MADREKATKRVRTEGAQPPTGGLELGARVKILHSAGTRGRIVELRGPLGPGGARIYRVCVPRKPKPRYIELREDQLVPITADQ